MKNNKFNTMVLNRIYEDNECTIGQLFISPPFTPESGHFLTFFCDTLELPDKCNKRDISRIPAGLYKIKVRDYDIVVYDVEGRDGILIHIGNTPADTKGCILVGSWSPKTPHMVINSAITMQRLSKATYGIHKFLLINDAFLIDDPEEVKR